jgi:hypothetical protein
MDNNGEIPWSCSALSGAGKAKVWPPSDGTAVLAWRLAAASPAILAPSLLSKFMHLYWESLLKKLVISITKTISKLIVNKYARYYSTNRRYN